MSAGTPPTTNLYVYVGSKLTKSGIMSDSSLGGASNDCYYSSTVYVQNYLSQYVGQEDGFFG